MSCDDREAGEPVGPKGEPLRLHASCAARGESGVLLLGPSGAGKSDLLLRLMAQGFDLVADDRVVLEDGLARAPAVLRGLIELRGWGIVRRPFRKAVRPVLCVRLLGKGEVLPRLPIPEQAREARTGLPQLWLEGLLASAVARVEMALDCVEGRALLQPQGAMLHAGD